MQTRQTHVYIILPDLNADTPDTRIHYLTRLNADTPDTRIHYLTRLNADTPDTRIHYLTRLKCRHARHTYTLSYQT